MEIIVLDDNSTDDTSKKVKSIVDNYNSGEYNTVQKSIKLIGGLH